MSKKESEAYQHAGIILDVMVKESGLSQTKFAEEHLKIKGVNISEARKTKKIPERWFKIVEKKLGLLKEDLCTTALDIASNQDYKSDQENNRKRGLSLERHREVGMELLMMYNRIVSLTIEFGSAYPRVGSLNKPEEHLLQAANCILKTRDRAEENLYKDFREETAKDSKLHYYYPGPDITQEDLHLYLANAAKEISELIDRAESRRKSRKKRAGKSDKTVPAGKLTVNSS